MSQVQSAPRWGAPGRVAVLLAIAMVALAAFGPVSAANAEFTTGKCAGPNIIGRGASFARDAHSVFNFNFKHNYCVGTPGQDTIDVAYDAAGSGAGRTSMKVRNDTPRFGQTDEPPTPTEVQQMNKGTGSADPSTDANPNDNGQIRIIPAAVGAVSPLVNLPNGCTEADINAIPTDPTQAVSRTTEQDVDANTVPDGTVRLRFNKATFEEIWAQGASGVPFLTWGQLVPAFAADVANAATCANMPIIRVVRFDESGTTFAFKSYLNTINPARGWLTTYAFGTNLTKEWPGATFGPRTDCTSGAPPVTPNGPGSQEDTTDHLTSGCANGNGALVPKLISTDGSIGYSDVSTARNASPSLAITPRTAEAGAGSTFDNDTYWTQVQNGSGTYTEPTADPNGFRVEGSKGANCGGVTFSNVPADTLNGDWSKTQGVNAPGTAYGICTLTYGMVFDDNAAAWGNTPQEEQKARSVKDYWESIVSDAAQGQLFSKDYGPLPASILALSRAGVGAIGWNKSSSGGGGDGGGGGSAGGGGSTGGGAGPSTPVSNQFTLSRKAISSKTGGATLSIQLPGPGKLDVMGTAKAGKKKITVGHVVLNAAKGGTFNVTLKPSGPAKKVLNEKGKLNVSLKLTFSPTGGTVNSSSSTLTLKLAKQH